MATLNNDPLLLSKEDFLEYRDTSANMDATRIDQSIREAQVDEMLQFLGEELYLIMMKDWNDVAKEFDTAIYNELWFGVDYSYQNKEIRFHGLQPAVTLYAYARMLDNIQVNVTRAGVVTFTEESSEPTEQAQIATKVKSARSQALVYLARADKFLNQERSSYPQYQTKDTEVPNKTSFQFFKI